MDGFEAGKIVLHNSHVPNTSVPPASRYDEMSSVMTIMMVMMILEALLIRSFFFLEPIITLVTTTYCKNILTTCSRK